MYANYVTNNLDIIIIIIIIITIITIIIIYHIFNYSLLLQHFPAQRFSKFL